MRSTTIAARHAGALRLRRFAPKAISRAEVLPLLGLSTVLALAGILRFSNLAALGYVNHYYTAATVSMLQTWHNFFYAAAEPGGAVSVDKTPVGLWIQAISASIFGVNTFGVLLPELLAGMLSVLLLYHLVQRQFGVAAGLVAGLALAITPVAVATDRNNTIDSLLILTLLLAAWAFIKATESSKLNHLLLGAALVGVGFNIKMLQAFLPLPAFYALYFLGARQRFLGKIWRLAAAGALMLLVSLSWVTIVDLTPADQRPYVGSSGDNSEASLIIGYNGLQRLLGGAGGTLGTRAGNWPFQQTGSGRNPGPPQARPNSNRMPLQGGGGRQGGFQPGGGSGGFQPGGAAAGFSQTGWAGPLRLFTAPLSKEASWLLAFGLFGCLLLLVRSRLRWPIEPGHQAAVLWGGWLLAGGLFFSVAGFFHEYYLSMLAAPIAALAGIGVAEVWQVWHARRWLALGGLLAATGVTLGLQFATLHTFVKTVRWLPVVVGLFIAGVVLAILARSKWESIARAGFACLIAAMLITPGIWSVLTMLNPSVNQSLPAAYDGQSTSATELLGLKVDQGLLAYLEAHMEPQAPGEQNAKYLMAVPSAMQGSDYVVATGRPVLYLGGFMGQDQVVTSAALSQMVAKGELRYVYWTSQGGGFRGRGGSQSDISNWVASACTPVRGFETVTRNMGAPGGTSRGDAGSTTQGMPTISLQNFGAMQITLYDCGEHIE